MPTKKVQKFNYNQKEGQMEQEKHVFPQEKRKTKQREQSEKRENKK